MGFRFRPLTDDDLPLLHGWLNEPGVVEWWEGDDVSWEAVVADYGAARDDPIELYLAELDGEPFGWIQLWDGVHEEAYAKDWWALGANHSIGGIDYLVGPPASRGQGLGSQMLAAFVADVGFGLHPHYTQIGASPSPYNHRSWRALQRAGMRSLGTFGAAKGDEKLMVADRPGTPVLRAERPDDVDAIAAVVTAAFGSPVEAGLVAGLRSDDAFLPDLSVVAERDGRIVGHVMVTWAEVGEHRVLSLSPLAVEPELHGQGIGSALVYEAIARSQSHPSAVLLLQGAPAYYGRFGFQASEPLGITMDLPSWAPREAAQAFLLKAYDPKVRGHVVLPAPFDDLPAE